MWYFNKKTLNKSAGGVQTDFSLLLQQKSCLTINADKLAAELKLREF